MKLISRRGVRLSSYEFRASVFLFVVERDCIIHIGGNYLYGGGGALWTLPDFIKTLHKDV
jgi:hypothetical protein